MGLSPFTKNLSSNVCLLLILARVSLWAYQNCDWDKCTVLERGMDGSGKYPKSLPASKYFPMSQLFAWGGQSTSTSFSIILSKENPGLISFRMDWLDLLAVQGTLKSLRQHHSSIVSILQHSAFFIVQLSHPYMTTGKTIALIRRTSIVKVMSLLYNISIKNYLNL